MKPVLLLLLACALASCEGHPDVELPAEGPYNLQVFLPVAPSGSDFVVDTVGANRETRDNADSRPPISRSFSFTCARGTCIRFNLFLRGVGWAAGENCLEVPDDSYIWPVTVRGSGEARPLMACCPHNADCNLKNPMIREPKNEGGAWWVVGVLPNGQLATTVKELESICPDDVRGAFDYDPAIFADLTYRIP